MFELRPSAVVSMWYLEDILSADEFIQLIESNGDPDKNRTCNPLLRRQVLYPVELRDHFGLVLIFVFWTANQTFLRFRFSRTFQYARIRFSKNFIFVTKSFD